MKGLAIVTPNKPSTTETFIQSHINELEPSSLYYGGSIPLYCNQKPIQSFIARGVKRAIGYLKGDSLWHDEVAFKRSLRKNRIGVILAEYGTQGAAIYNACRSLNIPLIIHFHGFDASMKSVLDEYSTSYRKAFNYASSIIAVSKMMKTDLMALGCPEEKILLNPCGPSTKYYEVVPDQDSKNILSIGRFVEKKAPYYLILAMHQVVKHHQDCKLVMIGSGPLTEVCENLIRYYRLENNVDIVGAKSPEEIMVYLGKSSLFIQHSIQASSGDKEGSPVSVMEASAAGLAVVATRHAGIPEAVVDGITGLLVDEHDVTGMANSISSLLDNKELRNAMGKKGRQHISVHFSLEQHIIKLSREIEKAAKT